MKKTNKTIQRSAALLLVSLLFFTVGCKKDDITDGVKPVSLAVQVNYDSTQKVLDLPLDGVTIKISNNTSGQSYSAVTNDKGIATFASISPGNYVVAASKVITADDYQQLTGIPSGQDVTFNASSDTSLLTGTTLDLTLSTGTIGNLVFKQIYYAGSDIKKGASFRDQFVEIYNNSNDTLYADSLYIGNTRANLKKITAGATTYDWSKSIGMDAGVKDPSKDFIYMETLFMIPGNGKDYPIAPGKSIVIATTALNHQKPYTDTSGDKEYPITNPELTVDLSKADFETYLQDYLKGLSGDPANFKPFASDIDNPAIPNLDVIYSGQKEWTMDATGREDFVLFKSNTPAIQLPMFPDPDVTEITSNTIKYIQVPVSDVVDAVEIITPLTANRTPKRLPTSLDGAGTFVNNGQYSSQSLIRKTAKKVGDRIILQDTNNSANDFDTKQKADPSKSAASFTTN